MPRLLERNRAATPFTTYLVDIDVTDLLGPDKERDLAYRVADGDFQARDHLVRANLRFVVAVAREFQNRGLSLDDLIQEGNLGLMRAVETFDPEHGTRFTTYAKFWIIQSIQRALDNMALPVRIPSYAVDLVGKWRRTVASLEVELGRRPSPDEVTRRLKLTRKQLRIVQKALRIYNAAPQRGDEVSVSAQDFLPADEQVPGSALSAHEEMQQVFRMLDSLSRREAAILRLRFGLGGQEPMTLIEIGRHLSLTRERVRQLEVEALRKLRARL
jgi:RNA polymerase primary sigma factor